MKGGFAPHPGRSNCLQTHGSLANWHPHLHLLVTDGGFRPDGIFVRWPGWPRPDTAHLTEAFRRAVLRLFVRRDLLEAEQAHGTLQWPHSGFHVHAGAGVPEDERAFAMRLARSGARNPVALDGLTSEAGSEPVTSRADQADGPTAGTAPVDPLEFLARLVTHIPDAGQVRQRYSGWYASRTRGLRRRQAHPQPRRRSRSSTRSTGRSAQPGSAGRRGSAGSSRWTRSPAPGAEA